MIRISILSFLAFFIACSQVNRESQEYYFQNKRMQHGIVTLAASNDSNAKIAIDEVAAKRGQKLYQKNCLSCHGVKGKGDGEEAQKLGLVPRNLREVAKEFPNMRFFLNVSRYKDKMPGWKEYFTPEQLDDLSHYLRSFGK